MPFGESLEVDVDGGALTVGVAGREAGRPVLLLHGISSSHLAWLRVARLLLDRRPDLRLVAPDARGRGRSDGVAGPFGIARNVADAVAVLDAVGAGPAVVAGHSMGAWVAARLAAEHPARVTGLVLVDGGVSGPPDPSLTLDGVLGPAVARLRRTFASEEEYLEFWRAHPAFSRGRWNADVEQAMRQDLRGTAPALRPRAREDAVRADFRDILEDGATREAHRHVRARPALVRARRGLLDQPEPFLSDAAVEDFRGHHPGAPVHDLAGANHYTVTQGAEAAVTAAAIAEALG